MRHRSRATVVGAFALVLILAACAPTVPDKLHWMLDDGEPIAVSPELEVESATTTRVPVSGGTVTATGADGTVYTLEIPADALRSTTDITMTPFSSIEGLPFGDGAGIGVQLQPDGLPFDAFATLTITPATTIPIDEQLTFGYRGDGADLALAPPVVDSTEIRILIDHFSGYGVAKGLLSDVEAVREQLGGDAERRILSAIAAELLAERQSIEAGGTPRPLSDVLGPHLDLLESEVLAPRIEAAGESCAAGLLAVQTVLSIERQRQLMGDESGDTARFADVLDDAGRACLDEEATMCAEQHIVHRMIPFVLWLDRQGQLLGAPLPVLEEAKQRAQDCLRFELEFRSDGVATDDGIEIASSVTATATIVFDPDSLAFTRTTAPLRNTLYTMGPLDGCSGEFESADVEFQVLGLQLIPSAFDLAAPADRAPQIGEVVDVELLMMTAPTQEIATFTCFGMTMPMGPFPLWSGMFGFTHQDEIVLADGSTPPPVSGPSGDLMEGMFGGSGMGTGTIPADSGFLLGGWEVVGGELFATRTWTRAADTIVETGVMELRHTPQ